MQSTEFFYDKSTCGPAIHWFYMKAPLMDEEYLQIFIFLLLASVLSVGLILLSYLTVIQKPDSEKLSAYECGFEPFGDARSRFEVQFYVVALLFVLFDIEVIFFLPWCLSISKISMLGFWAMIEFLLELGLGFVYAWSVGALDW